MKSAARLVAVIVFGVLALSPARPAQAHTHAAASKARVAIWDIYYNSPGKDTGSNSSLNHEWVLLHNTTGRTITLTHWTLRDTAHHVFTFGSYKLRAHGWVKIRTGRGRPTQANRYWGHRWYIWNNNGDTATLKTASGAFEARCKYSDPREAHAFTRCGR